MLCSLFSDLHFIHIRTTICVFLRVKIFILAKSNGKEKVEIFGWGAIVFLIA
jgi:hypothetical protein